MKMYTLIAYRPSHTSYSRGCVMGWSSSDHAVFYSTDPKSIEDRIVMLMGANEDDSDYGDYEFTLVVNGYPVSTYETPQWIGGEDFQYEDVLEDEGEGILANAKRRFDEGRVWRKAEKERLAALTAVKAKAAEEKRIEENDRKEFERLQKKFAGA